MRLSDYRDAHVHAGQGECRGVPGGVQGRRAGVSADGDRVVLRAVHRDGDTCTGSREDVP